MKCNFFISIFGNKKLQMLFLQFYQLIKLRAYIVCNVYATRETPYQEKREKMEIKSCKCPKYDEKRHQKYVKKRRFLHIYILCSGYGVKRVNYPKINIGRFFIYLSVGFFEMDKLFLVHFTYIWSK